MFVTWSYLISVNGELTCLICGDINCRDLRCIGALAGNTIDSLDLKAVLSVGLKVTDRYMALR